LLTFVGDIAELSVASGDANHMRTRDFRLQAATIGLVQKDMTNTMGISYHKVEVWGSPKNSMVGKAPKIADICRGRKRL
jgi:myo-inositol-hexaphosphate 3-phosphohydrolase